MSSDTLLPEDGVFYGVDMQAQEALTQLCEEKLIWFLRCAWHTIENNPLIETWHIGAICEHLQAVTDGQIDNLLICIPPGCSKSVLVSVMWPAWEWVNNPSVRWACFSHADDIVKRDAMRNRSVVESPWYQQRWSHRVKIPQEAKRLHYFETTAFGWRQSMAIGARGLTGQHPNRGVIDDAHDAAQVNSKTDRDAVREWWIEKASTRGRASGIRWVTINQRLHQGDLPGYFLETGKWTELILPMRYEGERMRRTPIGFVDPRGLSEEETDSMGIDCEHGMGALLCPKYYPEPVVVEMESVSEYVTAAQLQQRPIAKTGGTFDFDKVVFIDSDKVPLKWDKIVRAWDKAGTSEQEAGDYTAGVLAGRVGHEYYILDVVRGRWHSSIRDDKIDAVTADDWDRYDRRVETWIEQEPGSGGKQSAEITLERLQGYRVRAETMGGKGSKEARADVVASLMGAGAIRIVKAPWNRAYVEEMEYFPRGDHDDQVDATSLAFLKIARQKKRWLVAAPGKPEAIEEE